MVRFHKEEAMKCVICKGNDIVVKTVDEQIAVGDDILLIRLDLPVCSQCGERYYDRKAMQIIGEVRAKGKGRTSGKLIIAENLGAQQQ
jgi:YgiT-type zinc finger domain-containing protein